MLYPKNISKTLDKSLFENPTCEYRGTPFWAWNCKLNIAIVKTQIKCLKEMGFGGFHIHSRTGMNTKYLGDEFMGIVKTCVDKAQEENMLVWLYDEDRWPSGSAGGFVTKDPKYRVRKLVFTVKERADCVPKEISIETGKPYLISCYDILLNEKGELANYKRIDPKDNVAGERWYAYGMTNDPHPWYNNQTYVDTLNKEAIDKFIEITYDAYKTAIGDKFGSIVPAIFTDEPQFERKTTLNFAADKIDVTLPWSNDVIDTYKSAYGCDILGTLPELIWELPEQQISKARYLYHDHISERFASAFADNCGKWCEENKLMLTGHMMDEPTLRSQTSSLGDAMRSYRSFQLPGIDMLCDNIEFTTAKQAQSACHQYGREGVLSELYGVTNWDFDFRGHKFQGDWQAALGVSVRVPHLSLVSMAGEAKRDYPASINYQSPWYKEYTYVENHFARLNTALTRGKPIVKVGVIHPVESYWLHWGPKESTNTIREQLDSNFQNITKWLLLGQVDFDFICESLLPDLCEYAANPLNVGEMQYSTIIVPECKTLRQTTLDRLEEFQKKGGRLIFIGECPKYINALPSNKIRSLYHVAEKIPFDKASILSALYTEKLIDIRNSDGTLTNNLIYNLRQDSDCKWLFIAHGVKPVHIDAVEPQKIVLKIFGEYTPIFYNTINGEITSIDYKIEKNNTIIVTNLNCHDSILLRLNKKSETHKISEMSGRKKIAEYNFKQKVMYKRSEPNVLLLDTAQYAFDKESFQGEEEILRIDNLFREKSGFPTRQNAVAQPWTLENENIEHFITLKFNIKSEIEVKSPYLAIEDAEDIEIMLNNKNIESKITGHFVDESIKTVKLPALCCGENILVVKIPFGKTKNVEYCYILGDFNVMVEGCEKTIIAPTDTIGFSSIINQGMPFYGGNITYKVEVETNDCALEIKANHYRGALIRVLFDGIPAGVIAYAPYTLMLENVKAGKHIIEFTLFGNRYNTFGALHNTDTKNKWYGPKYWRSVGDAWCYEYKIKDTGILSSPVISIYESEAL